MVGSNSRTVLKPVKWRGKMKKGSICLFIEKHIEPVCFHPLECVRICMLISFYYWYCTLK